jgi:EAL and modified HD-GYP domain-containing signal transduction protein
VRNEVHSIRHAIALLGEREVRRWIRLIATLSVGHHKPNELVNSAMTRARFCELIGERVPHGESDLFLMGLLSMIDVILDMPMFVVLENIPVERETKAVLLGGASALRPLYQLMLARECGDWQGTNEYSSRLGLSENEVASAYWEAVQWVRRVNSV